MRKARTMLVVLGALAAATAQAQTSDPQPLPGNPPFAYPKVAQDVGVVGDVSFRVEVDAQGAATGVKVEAVPAHDVGFEEAVEKAVRKWRFRPAVKDGTPVPGVFAATVTFRLHPEDEEKIRRAVAGFAESWNGGRKDALRPLLDPEFTLRVPAHDRMKGNAAIDWLVSQAATGARLGSQLSSMTFAAPDLVVLDIPLDMAGQPNAGPDSWAAVLGRQAGEWRFVSLRQPTPGAQDTLRAGADIVEPRKLRNVAPVYPDSARQARIQDVVILESVIAADGRVEDVVALRGHPLLRDAAVDAVRQWRYTPTLRGGVAVPVIMTVNVAFRLR